MGESLYALRKKLGMTQDELAGHLRRSGLNWTRTQITDLERQRGRDVTLAEALLLAEALGVKLADLVPDIGTIRLGDTTRPAATVHALLAGELPINADLRGPTNIPGEPGGPHWLRIDPGGSSQIFTSAEVELARYMGYPVERIASTSIEKWGERLHAVLAQRLQQPVADRVWEAQRQASGIGAGAPPRSRVQVLRDLADELRPALEAEDA